MIHAVIMMHALFLVYQLGLHLMNITKFFKHVKAIKIIWTGVHCMFVAQMTIYTALFFEIGIEE